MVNDILNGMYKLMMILSILILILTWSIGLLSASVLMIPTFTIALLAIFFSNPFSPKK